MVNRSAVLSAAALFGLGLMAALGQIPTDDRSGRVSPFRGGQTTYMFLWDVPPEAYFGKNWLNQPQMLGPFFGWRKDALEEGITIAGSYTAYSLGCVSGGKSQGAAYLDEFFLSTIIDFGKLAGWDGWSVSLSARQVDGSFISDVVGTTPITSPAAEPNRSFRLGQMSLNWEGFNNTLQLSAGRLILNNQFAQIPQSSLFLNSALSGYPGSLSTDITFSGVNSARWGATIRYQPVEYAYVLAGTFSANPDLNVDTAHGLDFSLPPHSGIVTVAEVGFLTGRYANQPGPAQSSGPEAWLNGMPGAYKVGGIFSNAWFEDFNTGGEVAGNGGLYTVAEQMVYREPGTTTDEGLSIFGTFTYFPADRNAVPWFFSGGAFYQGLLPGRPRDQCGVAFSCAFFSGDQRRAQEAAGEPGQTNEMALEFAYSISLTPWAYITPDLQVLVNPGAAGSYPTAITIGVATGISF